MDFEEVQVQLVATANERYDKLDLSRIAVYLEEQYIHRSLCEWINQKFGLKTSPDELAGKEGGQIEEYLLNQARERYRRREIEYPVDFILNVAMRREQSGSSFAAKEVADWVKRKFRQEMSIEEIQNLSFDKIKKKLLDLNESYYDGQLVTEIESALRELSGDGSGQQQMLADWAKDRFQMAIEPDELDEENAREVISRGARQFLRSELTELEKYVLLQIYDSTWKDHLYSMDHLKSGIGLRGYAEKDPKIEYKREGYRMFQEMLSNIRDRVTDIIFKARLESSESMRSVWNISNAMHAEYDRFQEQQEAAQAPQGERTVKTIKLEKPKVGRNDPCPCGSGKKYKKCCGKSG
jgi:preprotein translocase subunit SecA